MFYSCSDLQAMLTILHPTMTQTCWLPLLQNKTEEYIGNNVKNTIHSNAILNIQMYSYIPLGLKITQIKIPRNVVDDFGT